MSGNILVVDDDKEIVQAIAINLEQEGFRVFKAYDGLEALEIAMSQDLDVYKRQLQVSGYQPRLPTNRKKRSRTNCLGTAAFLRAVLNTGFR